MKTTVAAILLVICTNWPLFAVAAPPMPGPEVVADRLMHTIGGQNQPGQENVPDLLGEETTGDELQNDQDSAEVYDPLEPINRVFYKFNEHVYDWLLKPITDGYIWIMPRELRECFGNFFDNVKTPVDLVNTLLQADFQGTGVVLRRFFINSSLGVLGFADVAAREFDLNPRNADFGQTLGKWGVGEGVYFCWPVVGPSNVRDSLGLVGDSYLNPVPYLNDKATIDLAYYSANKVNSLSLYPEVFEDLRKYSLDPYVAARQAYYEYRKNLINRK